MIRLHLCNFGIGIGNGLSNDLELGHKPTSRHSSIETFYSKFRTMVGKNSSSRGNTDLEWKLILEIPSSSNTFFSYIQRKINLHVLHGFDSMGLMHVNPCNAMREVYLWQEESALTDIHTWVATFYFSIER